MILDEYETELINAVTGIENDLMEIEMLLQDALSTSFSLFKDKTHAIN